MHELPEGLATSLRSWRGSVYSTHDRGQDAEVDLEKGRRGQGDEEKQIERGLSSATASSDAAHRTAPSTSPARQFTRQHSQNNGGQKHHPEPNSQQQKGGREQVDGTRQPSHQRQDRQPKQSKRRAKSQEDDVNETVATTTKQSVFTAPKVDDPDPAADRIASEENAPLSPSAFHSLIGMRPPDLRHHEPDTKPLALQHGLYAQIQHRLSSVQTKYRTYDILTYVLLLLQLALSAVFIVLGSLAQVDSHIAIAVLGAVSTVIGSALALMKGQGLPNRLRQTRDGLRNVVFEAEELYWDFQADRAVYFRDVVKLREDYLRVVEEARRNHPDTWNSTTTGIAQGVGVKAKGKKAVAKA